MVDEADHITGKTGLTPTVTISKNGGSFASPSGAVTELANGWYLLAGHATDRDTLGDLLIHATGSGADPMDERYCVVPWNPFDGVRLGMTALPNAAAGAAGGLPLSADGSGRVDVIKINGTSQTARDIGASVLISSGTGTGQLSVASGVIAANATQILGTAITEGASGRLAGGFVKWFNVAMPTGTVHSLPDAAPSTAGGLLISAAGLLNMDDMGGRVFALSSGTILQSTLRDNVFAQAATSNTITLDAGGLTSTVDGAYVGASIIIERTDASGPAVRQIVGYVGSTRVATVYPPWATQPYGSGTNYTIVAGGGGSSLDAVGVRSAVGLASPNLDAQLSNIDTVIDSILVDTAEIGTAGAGLTNINLPNQTMDIVGNITGNLSGSVSSVTGNVTGSVGSVLALANNAITASTLASSAVDKIVLGLGVDGHTYSDAMALILSALLGNTDAPSADVRRFFAQDGESLLATATYGGATGVRTIVIE